LAAATVVANNALNTATGALGKSNNLSDLASLTTARSNLGLGTAAIANIGTTAGTVAAGDDARLLSALTNTSALDTNKVLNRTLASWVGDTINARFKGAICDGSSHPLSSFYSTLAAAQAVYGTSVTSLTEETDAAALNLSIDILRKSTSGSRQAGSDFSIAAIGRLLVSGSCLANVTIDATNINGGRATLMDFSGSTIISSTNGTPGFDIDSSIGLQIEKLSLVGATAAPPNVGFLAQRPASGATTYNVMFSPTISGTFTKAAYANVGGAEDNTIFNGYFANSNPATYTMILDGLNHNNICSTSASGCTPVDSQQSFNTFICDACKILATGAGSSAIWMGGNTDSEFIGGYAHVYGAGPEPAIIAYGGKGAIRDPYIHMHVEKATTESCAVQFTGKAAMTFNGFYYSDHAPQASSSIFCATPEVTSVTLENATLRAGAIFTTGAKWWDTPSIYHVDGLISSVDGVGYIAPGTWSGIACTPNCTFQGAGVTGSQPIPAVIPTSKIVNAGSLSGATVTSIGAFRRNGSLPVPVISPPPSGPNATAHAVAFSIENLGTIGGNPTGYAVGEFLLDASDTCAIPPKLKVLTIDANGAPTKISIYNRGYCSVYAQEPVSYTGSQGTGLTFTNQNLGIALGSTSVVIDNAGAGFTSPPPITWTGGIAGNRPVAQSFLTGSLELTAGGADINLTSTGINVNTALNDAAGTVGGFNQNLFSPYAVPATYTYGTLVTNNTYTYRVTNVGCTTATTAGPVGTVIGNSETVDGCVYTNIQSSTLYPELNVSDQGITFTQPLSIEAVNSNIALQVWATSASPNGLVTAPQGSIALDNADAQAFINQDGNTSWLALSTLALGTTTGTARDAAAAITAENSALVKTNNLSDLTNVSTARTNLGLGFLAQLNALNAPSPIALGGVYSFTSLSHQFLTSIGAGTGIITAAQPNFTDIYGSISPTQIPTPTSSTLGGVKSATAPTNQFQTGIDTSGAPTFAQPAYTNLSGAPTTCISCTTSLTVGSVIPGDLQVAYTAQTLVYDRQGPFFVGDATISFTLNYTTAAWATGAYPIASATPGTAGWINTGTYVYQSQVVCTATTGNAPTLTTVNATQTTADGCQWKVISVPASGNFLIKNMPYTSPASYTQTASFTNATSAFNWGTGVTQLFLNVPSGSTSMTLNGYKSNNGGLILPVSTFTSGTAYTIGVHASLRLGVQ